MCATGGEPEQYVAGADSPAVDRLRFLHDAHGESGKVVFAGDERIRMLGGLAADQRATGLLAAGCDSPDHLGRHADVESLADEVVEKEKRLGTLDEDVVDAHGDEIDSDGVVLAEREGELELGAHAVR